MRPTASILALVIASIVVSSTSPRVSAQSDTDMTTQTPSISESIELALDKKTSIDELIEKSEEVKSANEANPEDESTNRIEEPVTHTVEVGENLSTIAKEHETTWRRIWDKNSELDNPDIIRVGQELVIPDDDEDLEPRPLPEPVIVQPAEPAQTAAQPPAASTRTSTNTVTSSTTNAPRGSSSGNLYTPGYCTWYVKNRRPDLPNNLGNADTWVARARAQGLPTGSTPRVGAVGQQGMHVVYVERVNGDGTVTVSEMNWHGLYVISSRTVPASNFMYIY